MSFVLAGTVLNSRLLLGTARYPSPEILGQAIRAGEVEVVTVSLRREANPHGEGQAFWRYLQDLKVKILPNTAGCRSARDAIETAKMARELFATDWIKLEVIGDDRTLAPDALGLVDAASVLVRDGFQVLAYMTEDISIADRLVSAGVKVLMPWGAPIGTGLGLCNPHGLAMLRHRYPDLTMLVDAGLGCPSHAAKAMELGFDGVLVNTAVARANDPVQMAAAFAKAVEAGRLAYTAGAMLARHDAVPSTPHRGRAFMPAASEERV